MSGSVEARGLRVDYGRGPVLEGVDLRCEAGEFVGLLGRNGSGKTTLLRALLGLVPERRGAVSLAGRPLEGLRRRQIAQSVAWVPQEAERAFAFRVREVCLTNPDEGGSATGNSTEKQLPRPVCEETFNTCPNRAQARLTIARPRPSPVSAFCEESRLNS